MSSAADTPETAFAELANKTSDLTWILCSWDKASNGLNLVKTGKGNYQEFTSELDSKQVLFGVYKVQGIDEQENVKSTRDKLCAITWVGPNVSPLARNHVLASKTARTKLFNGCAAEFQTDDLSMLTERDIAKELLRSGGAHKPTHYAFGDTNVPLTDLK